jgi:hypothetical protein
VELLEDRMKLEKYYRNSKASPQTIQSVRIDAYLDVVKLITGVDIRLGY